MSFLSLFQYDFMVRALIGGIIVSIIAPMVGIFLVVRRYSLMADTLAHVSLTGVALGILTNIHPLVTALVVSVVASLGIEQIRIRRKILSEAILAVFLSGSLAFAIILLGLARNVQTNITSYLFGSIATIQINDLYLIATLASLIIAMIILFYRQLFAIAFDEQLARTNGVPVKFLNTLFIILAASTIALSIRIVGVLLIGALIVIPVITAMQFRRNFKYTLAISILFSLASVIIGLIVSYSFGLASGGTIVASAILFFIVSLLVTKRR